MAFRDFSLFNFKSKETKDKEQIAYELWAFPYGQEQRSKLDALMHELFPKGRREFLMVGFLTCKELYNKYSEKCETEEKALWYIINEEREQSQIVKKNDLTTFLALVLADKDIDERCEYPSADELRARALEFDSLRNKRR